MRNRKRLLRLVVPGGRSHEPLDAGADGIGSAAVGLRTLQEAVPSALGIENKSSC